MLHPLLHLIASRPQLLADHAAAYAELVAAEIGAETSSLKRQALLGALGVGGLGVAAVLSGVAVMLWAVVPAAQMQAAWALFAVPLPPALLSVACLLAASKSREGGAFDGVRRQVLADRQMLREVSA